MSHNPISDEELDAALAAYRGATQGAADPTLVAAALRAFPLRRSVAASPLLALAACAVFGLVVGFGAARLAPAPEDESLDALIAASFESGGFEGADFDG